MRVLILFSLLFPLAAGPLAKAVSARVQPVLGTWLMTGAALLLAGTSCGALGLLVLSPLVQMTWVANLGHWSASIVAGAGLPGGWTTSLVAAVVLGAALLGAGAFAVRRGRALNFAWQHARSLPGHGVLVVTEDAAADAYAVPGWPGRIVVSEGMLGALDDRGRAALLAHERAHLSHHHHWFTAVARLSAAANPLVRPLASAVEYSVERWADEAAAAEVGDRLLVARAIASAAIAAKATRAKSAMAGALGVIGSGMRMETGTGTGTESGICSRVVGRRHFLRWRATDAPDDGRRQGFFRWPVSAGREDDRRRTSDAPGDGRRRGVFGESGGGDDRRRASEAPDDGRRQGDIWWPGSSGSRGDRPRTSEAPGDGRRQGDIRWSGSSGSRGDRQRTSDAPGDGRRRGVFGESGAGDDLRRTSEAPDDGRRQGDIRWSGSSGSGGDRPRTSEAPSDGRRRGVFGASGGGDDRRRTPGAAGGRRRRGFFSWPGSGGRGDDGLAGAGPVPRRVAALLAPAVTSRRSLPTLAACVVFLGVVAVCALVAADHLQDLLSFAHATVDRSM